jgi:RNA polymerase sigma factor for flagellar operon FliA
VTPEVEAKVLELLPQVRSEAWKVFQTAPQQLDRDELQSLGYMGLVMAAERWERYCAEHGYSPGAMEYFAAYALRRVRGSILDALRSQDWVTRSVRSKAKAIRAAGQDLGASEAEIQEITGLTPQQQRDTLAQVARRPVSVDAEPVEVAEPASVAGQQVVHSVLAAVVAVMDTLSPEGQAVMALRFHQGKELKEIAVLLDLPADTVSELHNQVVLAVHDAMLRVVGE